MKFGIIGTGMIANFHAEAINAMAEGTLYSCYGRNFDKVSAFAEKYGIKYFTNFDEFLSDGELDLVTIATPSGSHMKPAIAALNAGKHVICEKPLEVTPEKIAPMIAAAKANGVTLAAILNRRFNESVFELKQAYDAGRFGTVKWFRTQEYYDSADWRGTWTLDGGGALMNQSIHIIDQLLYTVGPVKRLTASMACLAHDNIEVEDTAVAILEFENGAKGVIQGSTACYSKTGHKAEVNICGDEGSVFLADEHFRVWDFRDSSDQDAYVLENLMEKEDGEGLGANDPSKINFTGHQRNFEEVVSSIKQDRECSVSAAEALKAVEVICAIYESAKNDGKWITLSH